MFRKNFLTVPIPERLQRLLDKKDFTFQYGLLIIFFVSICYFELIYRLWTFNNLNADYIFSVLYALPSAIVIFLLSKIFGHKLNKIVAYFLMFLLIAVYSVQFIYYYIFHNPFSLYTGFRIGYAFQFQGFVLDVILKNILVLILFILPLISLILLRDKISFFRLRLVSVSICMVLALVSFGFFIFDVNLTRAENFSQYALYYKINSPELAVKKLGVLATQALDAKRYLFGFNEGEDDSYVTDTEPVLSSPVTESKPVTVANYNIIKDINFGDSALGKYFSSASPTPKNLFTGMLKGNNLIFIVAESFWPYAISPELTPTLYKMSNEGFIFKDFYNPVWQVSTSDGEYVSSVGLIPKSGTWSMYDSSKIYLPMAMGNQFKNIGYVTKAYHNNTYTYYHRNVSIPNLGYDYKGLGSGVKVKQTWPESDLEMIENTTDEYLQTKQPFHVYYMTVSGHLEYNFSGNYIAKKNKEYVDKLPYSEPVKAYLAANLELEFAMKRLIEKLDSAGALNNTVIAITNDHYPYGLEQSAMDELAGHKIESNFELYKGVFILWKQGLGLVKIDKPVSNLDILPTISNLFGLDYDSRLLMGKDVLSESPNVVIFLNRSWITDKQKYNSTLPHSDSEYEKIINITVANKFKYSKNILETDYYRQVFPRESSLTKNSP